MGNDSLDHNPCLHSPFNVLAPWAEEWRASSAARKAGRCEWESWGGDLPWGLALRGVPARSVKPADPQERLACGELRTSKGKVDTAQQGCAHPQCPSWSGGWTDDWDTFLLPWWGWGRETSPNALFEIRGSACRPAAGFGAEKQQPPPCQDPHIV